jgi:hypothetical protein
MAKVLNQVISVGNAAIITESFELRKDYISAQKLAVKQ